MQDRQPAGIHLLLCMGAGTLDSEFSCRTQSILESGDSDKVLPSDNIECVFRTSEPNSVDCLEAGKSSQFFFV